MNATVICTIVNIYVQIRLAHLNVLVKPGILKPKVTRTLSVAAFDVMEIPLKVGYELLASIKCFNINECITDTHTCGVNTNCYDNEGSFECFCKEKTYGRGLNLSQIDFEVDF